MNMSAELFDAFPDLSTEVHLKMSSVKSARDKNGHIYYVCNRCVEAPSFADFQSLVAHTIQRHFDTYSIYCGLCMKSYNLASFANHVGMHMNPSHCGSQDAVNIKRENPFSSLMDIHDNSSLDALDPFREIDPVFSDAIKSSSNTNDGVKSEELGNFLSADAVICKIEEGNAVHNASQSKKRSKTTAKTGKKNARSKDAKPLTKPATKNFECDICQRKFIGKQAMMIHIWRHLNILRFVCSYCPKAFPGRGQLTDHERIHTGEKPHKCSYCDMSFRVDSGLRTHVMTYHTLDKPFQCEICAKNFVLKGKLKRHMLSHLMEYQFKCPECDKGFKWQSSLRKHQVIHTGELPYLCFLCGIGFSQSGSLKSHIRSHSGKYADKLHHRLVAMRSKPRVKKELLFKCTVCPKKYSNKGGLNSHLLVHMEPQKCPYCDEMFKGSRLDRHVRKEHMKTNKRYQCGLCAATFKGRLQWVDHMNVHMGNKPYSCSECGKTFAKSGILRAHRLTHTDAKPFSCTSCGGTFKTKQSLKDHSTIHTGEPSRFVTYRRMKNLKKIHC